MVLLENYGYEQVVGNFARRRWKCEPRQGVAADSVRRSNSRQCSLANSR